MVLNMGYFVKLYFGLVAVFVAGVLPSVDASNFPISGCSTDDLDILFLYYYARNEVLTQDLVSAEFAKHLLTFPSNKTSPRVMLAHVYDRFSVNNPHVNVSSWDFRTKLGSPIYGRNDLEPIKPQYTTIQETIELKVTFVKRLFSEMGGARRNVTQIAVLFLDGAGLSYEESRSVPQIVREQGTDIKIFVVVLGVAFEQRMVSLSDTLLITHYYNTMNKNFLTLAMCNQCMQWWWPFENKEGTDSISCYKLLLSYQYLTSYTARYVCWSTNSALLAGIETQEEMVYLRSKMVSLLTEIRNGLVYSNFTYSVHIGLRRDTASFAKRFQWESAYPAINRPLTSNNWFPGEPSGGYSSRCAVWQFVWRGNLSNASSSEGRFVDGWTDVGCFHEVTTMYMCELGLPRRMDIRNATRIRPARNDSFHKALAKGDFVIFEGNIVSVSSNIASTNFLKYLKEVKPEFPVFDCGVGARDPRFISYQFVCDYIDHCSNRADESLCLIKEQDRNNGEDLDSKSCSGVYCCDGSCLPVQWVNDGQMDCTVCDYVTGSEVSEESKVFNKFLKSNRTCALICNEGTCVREWQLNDRRVDCTGDEGPLDETIGKLKAANTCYNILGKAIWAPLCVYVKDFYGAVIGCRNMFHLENCTKFECPEGYFKCPGTYCIPQHYVLDGKVDCPTGEEEQGDLIEVCSGNFACWDSKVCLHPDLVCDGHPDCPRADDEVDCNVTCIEGFSCTSGTVQVLSDHNTTLPKPIMGEFDERTRLLDMSGVDLSATNMSFLSKLDTLIIIKWSNCKLSSLPYIFSVSSRVQHLDISHNLIQEIDGREHSLTFEYILLINVSHNGQLVSVKNFLFPYLETLDLSYTGLSDVDASFFVGLPSLKHLGLSYTFISNFSNLNHHSSLILQTLDLRGLPVNDFYEDLFNGLTIKQNLYTDNFEVCCPQVRGANIPYYTCHAPDKAISSCSDLIGMPVQRVLLWLIAIVAVLGNSTVIVYRLLWDRSVLRTGYGLFVTNLGVSDLIMGVYLFVVAGADYYYRDMYVLHDRTWRESHVCRLAGFLATLSSETSIFFAFLITLDRFLVMKFPFGQIKLSEFSKIIAVLLSWIVGFLLASIPILISSQLFSSNGMCIGLPLTHNRLSGWEYTVSVFVVLNVAFCIVIAYGQSAIFRAISENRIKETALSNSSRLAADLVVAKQLSLVALSNFICWLPIGLMGVLSLVGYEISNDVYAWTTVIVLPVNSAANPLLYTIPALIARWEKFKKPKGKPPSSSSSSSMSQTKGQSSVKNTR